MQEFKDTIKKVLKEIKSKAQDYKRITHSLKKVLEPKEMRYIHINSFKEKVLRIDTNSVVVLYQLNLKKNLILKEIQQDCGLDSIKRIVFRLAQLKGDNYA